MKGGHLSEKKITDLLLNKGKVYKFISDKIETIKYSWYRMHSCLCSSL